MFPLPPWVSVDRSVHRRIPPRGPSFCFRVVTEEILKVDVSLYKIIPVRQAQSGQILEGDVFGRNDEFIAERGTEIDE